MQVGAAHRAREHVDERLPGPRLGIGDVAQLRGKSIAEVLPVSSERAPEIDDEPAAEPEADADAEAFEAAEVVE